MKMMDAVALDIEPADQHGEFPSSSTSTLNSPFAQNDLLLTEAELPTRPATVDGTASPFTAAFATHDAAAIDSEVAEMLLAELEDEDLTEALEALAAEAAARTMRGTSSWSHEVDVPILDSSDTAEWMESIGSEVDGILAELEDRFRDRPVESVTGNELDEVLGRAFASFETFSDPLDARELLFGSLKKIVKKVANTAKNVVKKGVEIASKVMPLGIIYGRLRKIIKPLLRRVLAKAIGKLPRSLRAPARRLAARYGLRPAREFESEFELFAADFNASIAEAMTSTDAYAVEALEAEIAHDAAEHDHEPNAAARLDAAREQLTQQLLAAEPGHSPVDEMEQFIPAAMAAVLPVMRTAIKLIGRQRVVNFLAGRLASLIAPVVGRQLAKPLSVQIADKGLALLSLEAEASGGRLGAEAVVATVEDTLAEVFSMPDELLEKELYVDAALQDAFHQAAARHFPSTFLKPSVAGHATGDGGGVWVMMPRVTAPLYRYKKFSQVIPVRMTRPMAREVVFSDGETLEDRIADTGETTWPVDVEFEVYELLPASDVGHLAAFESDVANTSVMEATTEFDTLETTTGLPVLTPARQSTRGRPDRRRLVRVRARGQSLRRRSPVSLRLDLSGQQPVLRLHVWLSERRAAAIAAQLSRQAHRDVVATFMSIANPSMRRVVARRLGRMLRRRQMTLPESASTSLTDQLFDGLLGALAKQLPSVAGTLARAAKDPAQGLTVTAAFPFSSKDVIGTAAPGAPTLIIRAGRQRD
jgi:predicted aspartyl protease